MIYDLQQTDDPRDLVHRSVQALVEGQVVGIPSETVYGLVASSLCENAVERMAELVRGNHHDDNLQPGQITLSLRSGESVWDYVVPPTRLSQRLTQRCFPGPLTFLADCSDPVSAVQMLPPKVRETLNSCNLSVTQKQQTNDRPNAQVAIRVSGHRILSHIHRYLSAPLIWAEFRPASDDPIISVEALQKHVQPNDVALLLDDGTTRYGRGATVVHLSGNRWRMLQEGVIQRAAMSQFVKPVIAIVCTGNTCRSPMAETLLRDILTKKFGREDAVRAISAGVAAGRGSGASPQAVEVMGRMGLDLTGHSSQPLDDPLMAMADLVLTMTRRHRDAILAAWPDRADRVFTLRQDGGDVTDPVGMPVDVYQQCAEQIQGELETWVESLDDDFFPIEDSN